MIKSGTPFIDVLYDERNRLAKTIDEIDGSTEAYTTLLNNIVYLSRMIQMFGEVPNAQAEHQAIESEECNEAIEDNDDNDEIESVEPQEEQTEEQTDDAVEQTDDAVEQSTEEQPTPQTQEVKPAYVPKKRAPTLADARLASRDLGLSQNDWDNYVRKYAKPEFADKVAGKNVLMSWLDLDRIEEMIADMEATYGAR